VNWFEQDSITEVAAAIADKLKHDPARRPWSYADLQYADDQGYTVNTAAYVAGAWQVSATDYDEKGNEVRLSWLTIRFP